MATTHHIDASYLKVSESKGTKGYFLIEPPLDEAASLMTAPVNTGVLAMAVNGKKADKYGNIILDVSAITQILTTIAGNPSLFELLCSIISSCVNACGTPTFLTAVASDGTLVITFTEPVPAPTNGYIVKYRIKGSADAYTTVTSSTSPINITVADGVDYEGTIQSDCDGSVSPEIVFSTDNFPSNGLFINNALTSPGSFINSVTSSPAWYILSSGAFPFGVGEIGEGSHGLFSGTIEVATFLTEQAHVEIYIEGVLTYCQGTESLGAVTFTFPSASIPTSGDVEIRLASGPNC